MASLCPECGDMLMQSIASDLELWTCLNCGWRKRSMLVSDCCGLTYHVNSDHGVPQYFVCVGCGGGCKPKLVESIFTLPETPTGLVEESEHGWCS